MASPPSRKSRDAVGPRTIRGSAGFRVEDGVLRIDEGVERIPDRKFEGRDDIRTIEWPRSLRLVGEFAFRRCSALASVEPPEGLEEIRNGAFRECAALRRAVLPASLRVLGPRIFAECPALASVVLPPDLVRIDEETFQGCGSLASIVLPPTIREIGNGAFHACGSLRAVDFPPELEGLGFCSFARTGLERVDLPDSLKRISFWCFAWCAALREIRIRGRLDLPNGVFYNCPTVERIEIGPRVSFDENPAPSSRALRTILVDPRNPKCRTWNGAVFDRALRYLIWWPPSRPPVPPFPPALAELGPECFANCGDGAEEFAVPLRVRSIGAGAFAGWTRLRRIVLPARLERIDLEAFRGCRSLRRVEIPPGATRVRPGSFAQTAIRTLELPPRAQCLPFVAGDIFQCDLETVFLSDTAGNCPSTFERQEAGEEGAESAGEWGKISVLRYTGDRGAPEAADDDDDTERDLEAIRAFERLVRGEPSGPMSSLRAAAARLFGAGASSDDGGPAREAARFAAFLRGAAGRAGAASPALRRIAALADGAERLADPAIARAWPAEDLDLLLAFLRGLPLQAGGKRPPCGPRERAFETVLADRSLPREVRARWWRCLVLGGVRMALPPPRGEAGWSYPEALFDHPAAREWAVRTKSPGWTDLRNADPWRYGARREPPARTDLERSALEAIRRDSPAGLLLPLSVVGRTPGKGIALAALRAGAVKIVRRLWTDDASLLRDFPRRELLLYACVHWPEPAAAELARFLEEVEPGIVRGTVDAGGRDALWYTLYHRGPDLAPAPLRERSPLVAALRELGCDPARDTALGLAWRDVVPPLHRRSARTADGS